MSDYVKVPTSPEVWAVIRARHAKEMQVYGSFSNPDGREFGGSGGRGEMMTLYSLPGSDSPLIGCRTTWDIVSAGNVYDRRQNEKHEYWLCAIPARGD